MRKGLFDVDGLAQAHRVHRRAEVGMVGDPDQHGVDLVGHPVEHLPEILEARKVRKALKRLFGVRSPDVGVAERDDFADVLVPREFLQVEPRLCAAANRREPHLAVGDIRLRREAPRQKRIRACRKHCGKKSAPIYVHLQNPLSFRGFATNALTGLRQGTKADTRPCRPCRRRADGRPSCCLRRRPSGLHRH